MDPEDKNHGWNEEELLRGDGEDSIDEESWANVYRAMGRSLHEDGEDTRP